MPRIGKLSLSMVVVASFLAGCAFQAPVYQASLDNVDALRRANSHPMQVGAFGAQAGMTGETSIGLRADSMQAPGTGGYAAYLANALKQELEIAKLLDPAADIEISGVLLKNDISAGGISKNSGEIEARFIVRRAGQVRFDKIKRVQLEWESSFVAAIAIPKAAQQYPVMVQKLIGEMYSDADFVAAVH